MPQALPVPQPAPPTPQALASRASSFSGSSYTGSIYSGSEFSYEPDLTLAHHFPRTEYLRLNYYASPDVRYSARMLWAARDASTEWARAVAAKEWSALDGDTINLAVFDKAYELNQAQWPRRTNTRPAGWQVETDGYALEAYNAAARQLRPLRARMPPSRPILFFCRLALDLRAVPLVDAGPYNPRLSLLKSDDIGMLLGVYDPLVRHKAALESDLAQAVLVSVSNDTPLRPSAQGQSGSSASGTGEDDGPTPTRTGTPSTQPTDAAVTGTSDHRPSRSSIEDVFYHAPVRK
ncbi:hypothetical protein CcaverHIS631_0700020 [Cutaneotrichosporon cavernicola]|nr:hypothetical protein CcaverHIS631_0700020 [Cutaneotrichosporon cavernicola]